MPRRASRAPVLQQDRSRQTRRDIVAAAVRLWQDANFDSITVDTIVENAGVSKGTFYYHFRRKEDLLVELGWATVDRVGDEAEATYAAGVSLADALDVGVLGLVRRIEAMPKGVVARTIQEFAFRRPGGVRSSASGRHAFMSGLLVRAKAKGDIPPNVDADELADVLNAALIRTILSSVNGELQEPLVRVLRRRAWLVVFGLEVAYAPMPPARRRAKKRLA